MALKDLIATPQEADYLRALRRVSQLEKAIRYAVAYLDQGMTREYVAEKLRNALNSD